MTGQRKNIQCTYCDCIATTRDHVPPKIFLDPPLENCRTVPSCQTCNQKYGKDDEFLAYFVEFMRMIERGAKDFERQKIQKMYEHSSAVEDRIFNALNCTEDIPHLAYIDMENARISTILCRLAVAHTFLATHQKIPLTAWNTTYFFAKRLHGKNYEILGQPTREVKRFHDEIEWIADRDENYSYFVSVATKMVFLKIRNLFFAQAHFI